MSDNDRTIDGLENVPDSLRGCVLTVGNFDGVHLGHQRILHAARSLGESSGAPVAAMALEPPPDLVLRPADTPQRLTPLPQKRELLARHGAGWVVVARADGELLGMSPEEFIDRVVVGRFAPSHVVEGPDFFFGRGRAGNVDVLRAAGRSRQFAVHVVQTVTLDMPEGPQRVSSTLIRRLVAEGRAADAARCLGRPFALYGSVIAGAGHGRVIEFPTANIDAGEQVVPADGVYAGRAEIAGSELPAAISVGTKPTFGPTPRTIEAFLIGGGGDYYNQPMALSFLERLRDQRRFDGIKELRAQIAKDVQRVREICGRRPPRWGG